MSEKEIEAYLDKIDAGIAEAQHNMLVEHALHNRSVVIVDEAGNTVHVPAKQLLAEQV